MQEICFRFGPETDDHDPPVRRRPRIEISPPGFHAIHPVIAFVKGAPDIVLDLCGRVLQNGQAVDLTEEKRQEILGQNHDMASSALRVLGVAYRPLDDVPSDLHPR